MAVETVNKAFSPQLVRSLPLFDIKVVMGWVLNKKQQKCYVKAELFQYQVMNFTLVIRNLVFLNSHIYTNIYTGKKKHQQL